VSATGLTRRSAERPAGGGVPARRAVIRWAVRLLRYEWRQQLLILALITVAVGATTIAATVATDTPVPVAGLLGTARYAASVTGTPSAIRAGIRRVRGFSRAADVIENESIPVPGTRDSFDLRSQNPHGLFGGPLLSLVSGQYPAGPGQVAVTSGVAADFRLHTGSSWTLDHVTRRVTGIVQNPQSLLDEFALVAAGQVAHPTSATVLFMPSRAIPGNLAASGVQVATAQTVANSNTINPETISVAAAVLGMLLIALVGTGGFTVLAQRRLRAIGLLATQGATERHIRLVIRANGVATGVAGAVAGLLVGFLAWLVYRPHAETSAHHLMGVFQLPWPVVVISMALAVAAAWFAASRPARAIARTPIVAALAGRPPALKKTRHLAVPVGLAFLAGAFLLLGLAGAAPDGGGPSSALLELVLGFVALAVAIVQLAPSGLTLLATAGRRSPIAVRLALRDLARYRARSGPALAAISLSTMIAVIICVASAARFSNVLDWAGPNLTSRQLIVYAPQPGPGPAITKGGPPGPGGPPTPVSMTQARKVAREIAGRLGTSSTVTLETAAVSLNHAAAGRNWDGPIYVATPQLLAAFGVKPGTIHTGADILTMRPGLASMSLMQLHYGSGDGTSDGPSPSVWPCPAGSCLADPPIQEVSQLPSGTSAPNTVVTEHALAALHLQKSVRTAGWLLTVPGGLTPAQITAAQQLAAGAAGMSVETRNSIPSLNQIIDAATVFGIALALGILGMSVGLVRSEAGRDLRTLTAAGASGLTRRIITAATAGALAFTGAVTGIIGGYLAAIGFFRSNSLDGLSSLASIPLTNLLVILIGMPLAATLLGGLLAGRTPDGLGRQPLA